MKHGNKAASGPACLVDFRADNPDATWNHFREEQRTCYEVVRDSVLSDQSGLCAYCEILLQEDNRQVAHFHPKSDTTTSHNWSLDWENLWLACKGGTQIHHHSDPDHYLPPLPENISCDERKGRQILDSLVLSPSDVPSFPRIFRFNQRIDGMEIVPDEKGCQQAALPVEKVQKTIDEFNLNCPRLSLARMKCYQPIESAIKRLRQSGIKDTSGALEKLVKRHLSKRSNGHWPAFFTLVRWRFGNTAEQYLQSIAYQG
ncbi:MAG: TIGR02646 family protein [Magnetococcales bacterium]|nr:TIGR02646 family protein [Magnetococcales bacterium]